MGWSRAMFSITWACTRRGKGHCRPSSLKVVESISTSTMFAGGRWRPRIEKRASTVLSSSERSRLVS